MFLCTSMVLNTEVYAIDNTFENYSFGFSPYVKIKSKGGIMMFFEKDNSGNVMKYVCGGHTIYAKDVTSIKSKSSYNTNGTLLDEVTGTFYLSSLGGKLSLGEFKCEYSVHIGYNNYKIFNNSENYWERQSNMDETFYNYKITINSNIGNKLKFVGTKWNSSSKYYIAMVKNSTVSLPVESDLEVDGNYKFKGFSSNSSCSGSLLPYGDKVVLSTSVTSRTYWACFEEVETSNSFTFSIDGNGGTINGEEKVERSCSYNSCTLSDTVKKYAYSRNGYTFKGLDSSSNCSNPVSLDDVKVTKDKSNWYACWKSDDFHNVRFDANGGTISSNGLDSSVNAGFISSYNLENNNTELFVAYTKKVTESNYSLPTVSRSGYKFLYWITHEDALEDTYNNECSEDINKIKNNPELSYRVPQYAADLKGRHTYFACWEKESSEQPSTTTKTTKKTQTTAAAQNKFTVVFDGNDGTTPKKESSLSFDCTNSCSGFNGVDTFGKNGYKHVGWDTSKTCKNPKYLSGAVTSKVTYYACWEKLEEPQITTFKVTFDGNGGKNANNETVVTKECDGPCSYFPGVDSFSNGGKKFLGWDTSTNCSSPGTIISAINSAVTYYACWEKSQGTTTHVTKYTVAFNQSWGTNLLCSELGYDGTSGECTKIYDNGTKITLPTSNAYNSYNNYKFMFWTPEFTNNDTVCTDSIKSLYSSGKSYTVNSNITFAACYRETFKDSSRWAMEGASADGNVIPCGSELRITECIIESDGNEYCFYDKVGNKLQSGKIYRNKIVSNPAGSMCNEEVKDVGYKYGTISSIIDVSFECGAKLYITTCNGNICNFTSYQNPNGSVISVNGTVNKDYLKDSQNAALNDTNYCPKSEEIKKCSNDISKNVKSSITKKVCYDKGYDDSQVKSLIIDKNLVLCGAGYVLDKTAIRAVGDENCNSKYCERNFTIECKPNDKRGVISLKTTTVDVGSDGYGIVTVNATSSNSTIVGYYLSELYKAPTLKSDWISVSSGNFTVRSTPGNKYIWVKDSNGTISNVATVAVRDSVNLNTTLKVLELKDGNNNNMILSYVKENSGDGYTLLSGGNKSETLIAQGFNSQVHEYRVNVESPTLTVYATLTSSDSSYVEGYGPRTVNLTYGANTILIKIRNNDGKIRTYTIIANRTDDRSADNTLSNISLSSGDIDFNSNKTEYIIKIPAITKAINIEAQISSELAKFVSGYEPGSIAITGDTTVKLIKVESQTGSVRTYVLTFVREKSDIISKESLQLSGITIPGVNVPFESSISNYNITVDYETDVIDLYSYLKHPNSMTIVSIKKSVNAEYVPTSNLGISLDEGINYIEIKVINVYGEEAYYRLTIIRKEYGLGISDDTSLKDLNVLGYNIDFNPNKKEYNVKIKTEKSLVITAVPESNRAEVFIRGNEELTGFSTVRIKVVAENGEYETYSIDIKKDPFNKTIEIASVVVGSVIIFVTGCIIIMKKKYKNKKDYYRE